MPNVISEMLLSHQRSFFNEQICT